MSGRKRNAEGIGGAPVLNGLLNAVLAESHKAFTIRLRKQDTFDSTPLANIPKPYFKSKNHELSAKESAPQNVVRTQWDGVERALRQSNGLDLRGLVGGELLKAVIRAQLSAVHIRATC